MLLVIIKSIEGSASPTHNTYEAERKSKNRTIWIEFCNPNGYCFYCGYEVIVGHIIATCNFNNGNHSYDANLNNTMRINVLGGRTKNKPEANKWQVRTLTYTSVYPTYGIN